VAQSAESQGDSVSAKGRCNAGVTARSAPSSADVARPGLVGLSSWRMVGGGDEVQTKGDELVARGLPYQRSHEGRRGDGRGDPVERRQRRKLTVGAESPRVIALDSAGRRSPDNLLLAPETPEGYPLPSSRSESLERETVYEAATLSLGRCVLTSRDVPSLLPGGRRGRSLRGDPAEDPPAFSSLAP